MGTKAGVGRSTVRDSAEAGREATTAACAALDGPAEFCLVHLTSGHDPASVLAAVRALAPAASVSGCSAEGVIAEGCSDETKHSVAVLAVRSDAMRFTTYLVPGYDADPAAAGRELARQVAGTGIDDAIGLLVFPDGLTGNCEQLLAALEERFADRLMIAGGAAGEGYEFTRTHQFEGDRATTGAIAAVLVSGRGRLETDVSHGCTPVGLEHRVTRADGGWVHEIDHQPAWSVFRQYLDGSPDDLGPDGATFLSVGVPFPAGESGEYEPLIIRTPMGLDRATGSMFFPGGGFTGDGDIRLTRRDPDRVRERARASAARIAARQPGRRPAFVLQFDCAGRGKQLFGSRVAESIVRPLQQALDPQAPWIGFHTYGEIAPIGKRSYYHNYTAAICAFYDEP